VGGVFGTAGALPLDLDIMGVLAELDKSVKTATDYIQEMYMRSVSITPTLFKHANSYPDPPSAEEREELATARGDPGTKSMMNVVMMV